MIGHSPFLCGFLAFRSIHAQFSLPLPFCLYGRTGEIMGEDRIVGITFGSHDGCTDLTETNSMPPSSSCEGETNG